jgi:hypothetical protein
MEVTRPFRSRVMTPLATLPRMFRARVFVLSRARLREW